MKTINKQSVSDDAKSLLRALRATSSPAVVRFLTKAAIHQRDVLLEKTDEEFDLDGAAAARAVKQPASRKRMNAMIKQVAALDSKKDVSVFCAACIERRKELRGAAE